MSRAESVVIRLVILAGVAAWVIAFAVLNGAEGDDAMRAYTAAVMLAVLGATLLIIAAIFDSRRR